MVPKLSELPHGELDSVLQQLVIKIGTAPYTCQSTETYLAAIFYASLFLESSVHCELYIPLCKNQNVLSMDVFF